MTYAHLTAYVLSGTGNSFRAAHWLADAATEQGTDAQVIPIEHARPAEDQQPGPEQLVALFHPTHGLMPPWSMIKFILRLPRGRGAHAAVVATRGGIRIGAWVLPGAAGLAVFFPLLVLWLKGYRVRAGLGIDLPLNMVNLHWGFHPKNVAHILAWGRRRQQRLVDAVLAGRRFFSSVNLLWEAIWAGGLLALWPIFPVVYLLIGRLFMGKVMFADTRCRSCGRCARNCPNQAIVMVGDKPKTPFWTHRCEACLRCVGYCKFQAASASHLWAVVAALATSLLTAGLVQDALGILVGAPIAVPDLLAEAVVVLLTVPALILLYYVFWALNRIPSFRQLFAYLTLTRYWRRRYHEPETDARSLSRRG